MKLLFWGVRHGGKLLHPGALKAEEEGGELKHRSAGATQSDSV